MISKERMMLIRMCMLLAFFAAPVVGKAAESQSYSKISSMPEGLLDVLTKEEILDLIASIQSGAKMKTRTFQ